MKTLHKATLIFGTTLATAVSAASLEVTIDNVKGTDGMLMRAGLIDGAELRGQFAASHHRPAPCTATAPGFAEPIP